MSNEKKTPVSTTSLAWMSERTSPFVRKDHCILYFTRFSVVHHFHMLHSSGYVSNCLFYVPSMSVFVVYFHRHSQREKKSAS